MFRFHQPQEVDDGRALSAACPRCGFKVAPRAGWLTARQCPRCFVRDRESVPLIVPELQEQEQPAG